MKAGDIVSVKTTGELVYVLGIHEAESQLPTKQQATVRRAMVIDGGIKHAVEQFYLDELESLDDSRKRSEESERNEQEKVRRLFGVAESVKEPAFHA